MKKIKLFEEFVTEGIHDPGILKAFFMAGGPGSGKSYVSGELFGFTPDSIASLSHLGLKLINSDVAFEVMMRDAELEIADMAEYEKDPEKWAEVMAIRNKAKRVTKHRQDGYIGGRLGQVIDGTGKDYTKIKAVRELYKDLGYDTYMVFVNTSLEVALARNQKRARKLSDELVESMWKAVQENIGKFMDLFGAERMLIVDNSDGDRSTLERVQKLIRAKMKEAIQNPVGKKWIQEEKDKSKNKPY